MFSRFAIRRRAGGARGKSPGWGTGGRVGKMTARRDHTGRFRSGEESQEIPQTGCGESHNALTIHSKCRVGRGYFFPLINMMSVGVPKPHPANFVQSLLCFFCLFFFLIRNRPIQLPRNPTQKKNQNRDAQFIRLGASMAGLEQDIPPEGLGCCSSGQAGGALIAAMCSRLFVRHLRRGGLQGTQGAS